MTRQEFQCKVADFMELVNLYNDGYLTQEQEQTLSSVLDNIINKLR